MGGLLGVGGGFLMVPLQVMLARMTQRQANAASLAAIIPISIVGALVYYFGSRNPAVDLKMALLLMIGSVAGAYLGARLVARIPDTGLKAAVAILLLAVGIKELVAP